VPLPWFKSVNAERRRGWTSTEVDQNEFALARAKPRKRQNRTYLYNAKNRLCLERAPGELDNRARLALWRNLHEEHFGSTDLDFLTDREFSVRVEFAQFGALGLGRLEGTMRRIARTARHVAADPSDMMCLVLNRGDCPIAFFQRGREAVFNPETATLMNNSEPSEALAKADGSCFTLNVPRRRLRDLIAGAEDLVALPLAPASAAVRHLRRYLEIVMAPAGAGDDPALMAHIETTLLDLVALTLGAERDAAEIAHMRGLRAARVQAILAEIRAGFADPAFSPQQVARKAKLSSRYLQDLLQETGTSFTERVTELRLQKARAMLADPRHDRLKVSEIAYACGFNEVPHFNRIFRARFGASPTQFRGTAGQKD
jgi:AraC-like DNA-binding protein